MTDRDQRCKGCGAPIKGRTCEYCGRVFTVSFPVVSYGEINATRIKPGAINLQSGGIDDLRNEIARLQYQASTERQMAHFARIASEMTNVAACPIFNPINREMEKGLRR